MIMSTAQDLAIFTLLKSIVAIVPPTPDPRPIVSSCCACPDRDARTAALQAQGFQVSHGYCADCSARIHAELDAIEAAA